MIATIVVRVACPSSSCASANTAPAIRRAAAWYNTHIVAHLPAAHPTVVLLTDDAANRTLAEKDGVVALSGMWLRHTDPCTHTRAVRQYVEGMAGTDTAQLLDLLSATMDEIEPTRAAAAARHALYPDVRIPVFTTSC